MGMEDTKPAKGMSGEKLPKGVNASDTTGERKMKLTGGVAMGKADDMGLRQLSHAGKFDGQLGECKGGASEKVVYDHKRVAHDQDK